MAQNHKGSIDDLTSRANKLTYNGTDVVSYAYTGEGLLVSTTLTQFSDDRYSRAYVAGSPRAYGNLDQFGRVASSRWTADSSGTDIYKVDLTYDRGSNILTADDARLDDSSQKGRFDALYSIDNLHRLLRAKEGHLASGAISDSEDTRNEEWRDATPASALSQTGNWMRRRLDLNGDGDFTDTGIGEIDDTGTFNKANEWGTRDLDSNSETTGDNYTITHDAVGNMTDDGKDWKYEYDAFGRLRRVKNQSNALKAEYTYNGLGYRIGWHYDVDADGTVEDTTDDPWFYFAYDERWRIIATIRADDEEPKERFLYHAAGSSGFGGSSYIDSIILRDRDNNGDWGEEASDTDLETRIYYCQNWRADVSAILDSSGGIIEWVKYSSYGVPHGITLGDWNADGSLTAADVADYASDYTATRAQADVNFSGSVTSADLDLFTAAYNSGAGQVAGRGVLSSPGTSNRIGYAGYQWDPVANVYHVRHRVHRADLGRWTRRDPIPYVDGNNLYEYCQSIPVPHVDPLGTDCPGCDLPGGAGVDDCRLSCCSAHDQCYDINNCDSRSWWPWNGADGGGVVVVYSGLTMDGSLDAPLMNTTLENTSRPPPSDPASCTACNDAAVDCFVRCTINPDHRATDRLCYCQADHKFFDPPGLDPNDPCGGQGSSCCQDPGFDPIGIVVLPYAFIGAP